LDALDVQVHVADESAGHQEAVGQLRGQLGQQTLGLAADQQGPPEELGHHQEFLAGHARLGHQQSRALPEQAAELARGPGPLGLDQVLLAGHGVLDGIQALAHLHLRLRPERAARVQGRVHLGAHQADHVPQPQHEAHRQNDCQRLPRKHPGGRRLRNPH